MTVFHIRNLNKDENHYIIDVATLELAEILVSDNNMDSDNLTDKQFTLHRFVYGILYSEVMRELPICAKYSAVELHTEITVTTVYIRKKNCQTANFCISSNGS